jgi:putative chitinase
VSRIYGDASTDVQTEAIQAIIREGRNAGMSNEDIALTLAIAKHESGFNPDAAAGTTSAHGLGQFVNKTGEAYGITDENRWDINTQARALVEHTTDNIRLAERKGQGREYVYAYHHDGPSLKYGGLGISSESVMPNVQKFLNLVTSSTEQ